MCENKFWICINTVICSAFVAFIYLSTSYYTGVNNTIAAMVESGADPIAAMCAIQDDYGNHPTCIVLSAKSK